MKSKTAMRASTWVLKRRRLSSSHSRVAKKLSHMALSKQSPTALAHRGDYPVAPAYAAKPRRAHQPRHAFASHPNALLRKLGMDARSTIGGARAMMNRRDPRAQFDVRPGPCRRWTP